MMDPNKSELIERVVAEAVERAVLSQPWYQRYANTVTATLTAAVTLVYWLVTSGLPLPLWVHAVGGVVMFLAAVFGVNRTRNGMSPSTADAVNSMVAETVGRHRRIE